MLRGLYIVHSAVCIAQCSSKVLVFVYGYYRRSSKKKEYTTNKVDDEGTQVAGAPPRVFYGRSIAAAVVRFSVLLFQPIRDSVSFFFLPGSFF